MTDAAAENETARRRGTRRRARRLRYARALRSSASLVGGYHSLFRGQGMTFDDVRRYEPGDDVRFIDYNVSARLGETFVKRFIEEREIPVLLAVDVSSSVTAGLGAAARRATLMEVAELLALAASANGDPVGILTFSDRVHTFLAPRKGQRPLSHVLEAITALDETRRGTDLPLALHHAETRLTRRSVMFLISDFLVEASGSHALVERAPEQTPASTAPQARALENLNAALQRIQRRHTLIPIQIGLESSATQMRQARRDWQKADVTSPRSKRLRRTKNGDRAGSYDTRGPTGLVWIEDAESGRIAEVDARHLNRTHSPARWDGSAFGALFVEAGADPLPVLERGLQRRRQALTHPRMTRPPNAAMEGDQRTPERRSTKRSRFAAAARHERERTGEGSLP